MNVVLSKLNPKNWLPAIKRGLLALKPTSIAGWLTWASVLFLIGFTVNVSLYRVPTLGVCLGYLIPEIILVSVLLRQLKMPWTVVLASAVSLIIYMVYFSYTEHFERTFDTKHQLIYVKYIADNFRVPSSSHCFVCHHPPMFYAGGAVFYNLFRSLNLGDAARGVQVWGHLCHVVFLIYGILLLSRFFKKSSTLGLGTMMIGLFPYSVINSVRAHNDVLFDATYVIGLYYIVVWFQTRTLKHFYWATFFAGVCVATKMNGVALPMTLGIALLYHLWTHRKALSRREIWAPMFCLVALAGALAIYMSTREPVLRKGEKEDAAQDAPLGQRILGSAFNIGTSIWVENSAARYLYLDMASYQEDPFVYSDKDVGGRQWHLNHVLKSSIFITRSKAPDGETGYVMNQNLAEILDWLLLVLLGALTLGGLTSKTHHLGKYLIIWLNSATLIALSFAFKAVVPSTFHADFRFIFPVTVSSTVLLGLVLERWRAQSLVAYPLLRYATWAFTAISALYFIPKAEWSARFFAAKGSVDKKLSDLATIVPEKTTWNKKGNTIIPDQFQLVVTVDPPVDKVGGIELTVDNNDKYQITVESGSGLRHLVVGPHSDSKFSGVALYKPVFDKPISGVKKITVRPISGDASYSVGHLVLTQSDADPLDD
jgi:hypothetical protein